MKAAVRDSYGPPEVLRIDELPKPVPKANQVLVKVHAASVNRADLDTLYPRWQLTRLFMGLRRPSQRQLGFDVAGVVESVGETVTRFAPGDRVFGDLFAAGLNGGAAFAEYVCAREGAFQSIPAGISDEVAACLPHAAVLALQALRRPGGRTLQAGERLLVVGASGNVGPYLVQIAKSRGAHVTGVARGAKLDFVRSLGADAVIDYETTDSTRPAEPYDWIVEADAHHPLRRWRRALKPRGVYIALGGPGGWILGSLFQTLAIRLTSSKRMGMMLWWKPSNPPDMQQVLDMVQSGQVKPAIDRTYPLEQVVEALRWVDDGHARGKVVISIP